MACSRTWESFLSFAIQRKEKSAACFFYSVDHIRAGDMWENIKYRSASEPSATFLNLQVYNCKLVSQLLQVLWLHDFKSRTKGGKLLHVFSFCFRVVPRLMWPGSCCHYYRLTLPYQLTLLSVLQLWPSDSKHETEVMVATSLFQQLKYSNNLNGSQLMSSVSETKV